MLPVLLREWPALLALVLLTGCLTIEEHYTFKKDGSGSMTYVVDMSELGALMNNFGNGEGVGGEGMGTMDLSAEVANLDRLPGVSKVKLDAKKEWVQKISFRFKDVGALNAALNELLKDSSGTQQEFFAWDGGTLVRRNNRHAYELGAGLAKDDAEQEDEEDGLGLGNMLESMKYRFSFKFSRPISGVTLAEGVQRQDPNTRELKLETDFAVISRDPGALDLRIALDQ